MSTALYAVYYHWADGLENVKVSMLLSFTYNRLSRISFVGELMTVQLAGKLCCFAGGEHFRC